MSLTPIRVIFCLLTYPSSIDHRVNRSANKVSLPWLNAKITESTTSSFNSLKTKTINYIKYNTNLDNELVSYDFLTNLPIHPPRLL